MKKNKNGMENCVDRRDDHAALDDPLVDTPMRHYRRSQGES
jgi:hypothetical protein